MIVTSLLVSYAYEEYRSDRFVSRKHIYEILIAEARRGILIVDNSTGKVITFNRAAETTFGKNRDDIIGKPVSEILPHELAANRDRSDVNNPFKHPSQQRTAHIRTPNGDREVAVDVRDLGGQSLIFVDAGTD